MNFAPVPTNPRVPYEQVPIQQHDRHYTDCICTIVTAALAVLFFIFAVIAATKAPGPSAYFNLAAPVNAGDITSDNYSAFLVSLFWTAIISVSVGLLWMTFAHLFPTYIPKLAPFLALLALLALIFFAFFLNSQILVNNTWLRWVIAGVALLVGIFIFYYLCIFPVEIQIQGTYLRYATIFLVERPANFVYVFVWILLFLGLAALIIFQQIAYSYGARWNNNLFNFFNPYFWGVVNFLELLLGLQFLKDAFIFVISGNAVDWYWRRNSNEHLNLGLTNLLCHNWGSVVVGSYLNLFLRPLFLFLEIFSCHPRGCCRSLGVCCADNACTYLLTFIRTDAYAYTNIFGAAYCRAASECTRLCDLSPHFTTSQSPLRNYRIIATIFLTVVAFILGHIIFHARVSPPNFWFALTLLLTANALISSFVSLAASAAEGLMTSTQVELDYLGNYDYLQNCHFSVRKELQTYAGNIAKQTHF